jgi:hypothetical protein
MRYDEEKGDAMIELTEQQRQELKRAPNAAIRVTDPDTNQEYVLVRREVYEYLAALLDEDVRASGELVDRIMADDDANDPYLAQYQTITREGQA